MIRFPWRLCRWAALLAVFGPRSSVVAQESLLAPRDPWRAPLFTPSIAVGAGDGYAAGAMRSSATPRIPLFRMPTGYFLDPVGLDSADDPGAADAPFGASDDPLNQRLGVALGPDNPYFDMPAPGDPGGFGYYKLQTQYDLLDTSSANLCLALQAATPAGLDGNGLAGGPTRLRPALAYFQELEDGWALHGFVSRNVAARAHWSQGLEHGLRYGLAVQRPLPGLVTETGTGLHFFVEALGRSHGAPDLAPHTEPNWELLPGLHWRIRDDWWVSGGMIVPLERQRLDLDLWHVTCAWRF